MNTAIFVNTLPASGEPLAMAHASVLEEVLRGVPWLRDWTVKYEGAIPGSSCDLLTTLPLPGGGEAILFVVSKRELRPSHFRLLVDRPIPPSDRPLVVVPVLALPWVSPRIAEMCAEHGWSWFDLAGNHSLEVPGLLRLQHTGNEPIHERPRPTANLGTRQAARIIRALLAPGHAGLRWTQREIQEHSQPSVSLGLVNKVVRHLLDESYIEPIGASGFHLRDPNRLLSAWRDAYRFDRHVRRSYFTLLRGGALRDALASLESRAEGVAAYAAFSAADFQAPHVRQAKTWLYVGEAEMPLFEEIVEAQPVDSGENLVVLNPADDGVFYLREAGTGLDRRMSCTNVVQTYVDLCHAGGRGEEAAEALLNQRLKPNWGLHGLRV